MVIEEFGDLEVFHALEAQIGRELTLQRGDRVEMETISAPFDEVLDWLLDTCGVRPGFAELVAAHDPLIISAGFHELIDPCSRREGVDGARRREPRRGRPGAAGGRRSPSASRARCAASRASASRSPALGPFAYVGDGISDRCVSLAAERVFARDGLARWLDAQRRRLRALRRPARHPRPRSRVIDEDPDASRRSL